MTRIVAISGPAGCGKTTIAELASRRARAVLVDGDALFGPIAELLASHEAQIARAAIQAGLAATAAAVAAVGVDVLVVAPFTVERRDPDAWHSWATAAGDLTDALVELAWVRTPAEVITRRLIARGATRDAGKLKALPDWLAVASPETPPVVPHITLDGTHAERSAELLVSHLRQAPA